MSPPFVEAPRWGEAGAKPHIRAERGPRARAQVPVPERERERALVRSRVLIG